MRRSAAGPMLAVLATLAIVAGIMLGACGKGSATPGTSPGASASGVISASPVSSAPSTSGEPTSMPVPTATPSPVLTAVPGPAVPAGFTCGGTFSGGSVAAGSEVVAVRVGAHDGYDRFVVEFSGTIPAWSVGPHSPHFEASPSGLPVTLEGTGGVLIRLQPVAEWTSYRSPNYFYPQYPYLREARLLENFEAVQQWGLGGQGTPCLRVLTLDSPSRLVVDVYGG